MNPRSSGQTIQRMTMALASAAWRGLTPSQRLGWTAYGAQLVRTDSLGQSYTLTGLQAYTSAYRIATTLGTTPLTTDPGAPAALPALVLGAVTATA